MSPRKFVTTNVKRVVSLASHMSLPVYHLEGRFQDEPLRMLIADDGYTMAYMQSLAFPGGVSVLPQGSISALSGFRLSESDADVVVVGANFLLRNLYCHRGFRLAPKWVRLLFPTLDAPTEQLFNHGRQTRKYFKWMLKKVQDAGYVCRISSQEDWLDHFYNEMYVPYAHHKYGRAAVFHNYGTVRKTWSQGGAIVVSRDSQDIAAVVFSLNKRMRIPHFGAYVDKMDEVRDGANFALDFFAAELAHQQGCEYLDFGHSRPFLCDGVLKYKLNWKMDVVEDDDALSFFAITVPGESPQGLRWLEQHRCFEYLDGGIGVRDGNEDTAANVL